MNNNNSNNRKRSSADTTNTAAMSIRSIFGFADEPECKKRKSGSVRFSLSTNTDMHGLWLYQMERFGHAVVSETQQQDPVTMVATLLKMLGDSQYDDVGLKYYFAKTVRGLIPKLQQDAYTCAAVIPAALQAMQDSPLSLSVQIEGGHLLQQIVKSTPTEDEINLVVRTQAVTILVATLMNHTENITLSCLIMDLIRRFQPTVTDACPHIVTAIVHTMKLHSDKACVQQIGLSLAAWLAENKSCREELMQLQALTLFPDTMQLHATDSLIQCNAAAALCWLVHAGRVQLQGKHVQIVVETLKAHADQASVFGNCVCIICALTASLDNRVDIVSIVRAGMERHALSAKVQESCLRWIRSQAVATVGNEILTCLPSVLIAMKEHPGQASLQAQACEAMAALADGSPFMCRHLMQLGATDAVLESLSNHSDERTQRAAVWVLSLLMRGGDTPLVSVAAFGGDFPAIEAIWRGLDHQYDDDSDSDSSDDSDDEFEDDDEEYDDIEEAEHAMVLA